MKNITSKIMILFFVLTILALNFNIPVSATYNETQGKCEGAISEATLYYDKYNQVLDIKAVGEKYPDPGSAHEGHVNNYKTTYAYAITYVRDNGVICNLYLNEIPESFGIWNTDIVVNEGRVVVTGVDGDDVSAWNLVYSKYKRVIVGISGLGAITCVLAFVLFFIKMGSTAGNPSERSRVLTMLLFTGAGAAGLGAVSLIFGFFWNMI